MCFVDYIFYRIYRIHLNSWGGTIATSVLHISMISFFSLLPLIVLLGNIISNIINIGGGYTIFICLVLIPYFYIKRYYNINRIKAILKKYKNKKEYNKPLVIYLINIWTFISIPLSIFAIGFITKPIIDLLHYS